MTRESLFADDRAESLATEQLRERREAEQLRRRERRRSTHEIKRKKSLLELQELNDVSAAKARGEGLAQVADAELAERVQACRLLADDANNAAVFPGCVNNRYQESTAACGGAYLLRLSTRFFCAATLARIAATLATDV